MRPAFADPSLPAWTTALSAPTSTSSISPGGGDSGGGGSGDGGGGDGDGRETLQEWSSLIGIITAIVGNMLIALALNVQRYAHTRLHKERIQVRQRARAALKRAQSNGRAGTYGTILDDSENGYHDGHSHDGNGSAMPHPDDPLEMHEDNQECDPLMSSFQSTTTTEGTDDRCDKDAHRATSTYLKSPYWWLGQILITLGEMGNFLAYGFAPASIVSPLGVVALISNCIIAPAMFHEKFRPRDFWGVVIAISGVVTVVLSASQEETKLNPHDVWGAITTMEFEIYLGVTMLLIVILMWASRTYGKRTILIDLGLVGLFGGYTALSTKGVSSMLSSTLWGAFTTPVTYALILILLVTAVMQIRYVNRALQRFDSTQVIPIQFVMFTLCVIIGSAVLYRDFEKTTVERASKFVGGCLLTFFGVFLITSGRERRDEEEDLLSEIDGIEETIGLTQHDGSSSCPPPQQVAPTPKSQSQQQQQQQQQQQEAPTPKLQSRRSSRISRVSFAGTIKPQLARDGNEASTLRFPELTSTPTYLGEEAESLISNPWQGSWEAAASPPRGIRTISTDSVLTRSVLGSTPPVHSSPATPLRDSQFPPTYPTDQHVLIPRPGHGHSKSVSHRPRTFISPSPLSSTVTTVVKDAFLREHDGSVNDMSSLRRIRSSLRASLYFDEDAEEWVAEQAAANPASDDNLPRDLEGHEAEARNEEVIQGRSRSLSDTLGEFFRSKMQRKQQQGVPDSNPSVDPGSGSGQDMSGSP